MSSGATITIKDSGWSIVEDLGELDHQEIQAGVLEGTDAHEDISTADLALIHEDGAPRANIKARPFMRPTFDQRVGKYELRVERIAMNTVKGQPAGAQLVALADDMAKDQRETITKGRTGGPPLRPMSNVRVVRRRLGLTPLIDSGALVESLQGQVVTKRGGSGGG